jgi:hypothetical protein
MAELSAAFPTPINIFGAPIILNPPRLNERKENPQAYDFLPSQFVHVKPQRHVLGLVGGNEASPIAGNMVDLESDLRGQNIPITFAPWRMYQAPTAASVARGQILRKNTKAELTIDVRPMHLPAYQMWAYPGLQGPAPMVSEVCRQPEKY